MKLFKRFTALALAGVMMLGLLTGCATTSNSYGDLIVDATMQQVNSMRYWACRYDSSYGEDDLLQTPVKELKNDSTLKKELGTMLNKIDEDCYIWGSDAIQYKEELNASGRLDGTYKMVITYETWEWLDRFFGNSYNRSVQDALENEYLEAIDFWYSDADERDFLDMLMELMYLSPYMDSFAVTYKMSNGGVMHVAIGFTLKNAPTYLISRHPDGNYPLD